MPEEIWKPVRHWEGRYEVSNKGRIRCIATGLIVNTMEICSLGLKNKGKGGSSLRAVHRLVLEAFIGTRPKEMVCRHLDGNSLNNDLSNLKWGTKKENAQDCVKHGRRSHAGSPFIGRTAKLNLAQTILKLAKNKNLTDKQHMKFLKKEFPQSKSVQKQSFKYLYNWTRRRNESKNRKK